MTVVFIAIIDFVISCKKYDVVVNFISDRHYKNKDNLLTKQESTLVIAVRGHERSPWAHRAGGL